MSEITPTARAEAVLERIRHELNALEFCCVEGGDFQAYPWQHVKLVRDGVQALRERIRVLLCCPELHVRTPGGTETRKGRKKKDG